MKRTWVAALLMGFAGTALPTPANTAGSWLARVEHTADGGHRMGNPRAKVQLMEFVSYTCPHCADFFKTSDGPMQIAYVAPGKVALEVRHVIRNPVDLAAALLTECGPETKFFANHAAILRSQDTWLSRLGRTSEATRARWSTGPISQRMRAVAADTGFYEIMARRGYDQISADKCLSNEAEARRIAEQSAAGTEKYGVTGTPSFVLDGILLGDIHTWDALQPKIAARL